MKIALAQVNPTIGDFELNYDKIMAHVKTAVGRGCDLVVFSELVISGYPPRDLLEKQDFVEANLRSLQRLVDSIKGIAVICGFVDKNPAPQGNALFNSAVMFEGGRILHKAHKRLLPSYDVFDEKRYFEPGVECEPFSYRDLKIGLTICEDMWNDKDFFERRLYDLDPVAVMVEKGADIIINISASPFHAGKREFKWNMFANMAAKYNLSIVHVNQVGGNDSILFDGLSIAVDPNGETAARARDFEEDLVVFDTAGGKGDLHSVSQTGTQSILNALVMGLKDYMAKCGFSKALVGLSGGIDSAVTACIAQRAVGGENVTAVFMPSQYTSQENFDDTQALAGNLGVEYVRLPIGEIFDKYLNDLSPVFTGVTTEVTGQNLQARIRGTLLMALSNKLGCLLLSTGNKSEIAVGYCTLYGDMNGGVAVISDVPKTMVYELARLVNTTEEIIPKRILDKPPSAELKPDQLDQDDLPPYEILDAILKEYVERNKAPHEIIAMGFDAGIVRDTVQRIYRNEYKRHQAPPALKVTTKSFGYGRRFPIAHRYSPARY